MRSIKTSAALSHGCRILIALLQLAVVTSKSLAQSSEGTTSGARPVYLAEMTPLPGGDAIKPGDATILTQVYEHSLSMTFDSGRTTAVRYALKSPGYQWFKAKIGIDDSYASKAEDFAFRVIGNKNGDEVTLFETHLKAGQGVKSIAVPITDVKIFTVQVTLHVNANEYGRLGVAWWADAQFDSTAPKAPGIRLIFDTKAIADKLQELAQSLLKNQSLEELTITPFVSDPILDNANISEIESGMKLSLKSPQLTDLFVSTDSVDEFLGKGWTAGDNLEDQTLAKVKKSVDTRYFILGSVRWRREPKLATVTAALYDRRTGKSLADAYVRIPAEEVVVEAPPIRTGTSETPSGTSISIVVIPARNLEVQKLYVSVDGHEQPGQDNNGDSQTITLAPGPHKISLRWHGNGVFNTFNKMRSYEDVNTRPFDVIAGKDTQVTIKASVMENLFGGPTLNINADIDGRSVSIKRQ